MDRALITLLIVAASFTPAARAQGVPDDGVDGGATSPWRLDASLGFSRFEQQVKSEIGGATSSPVTEHGAFGVLITATYRVAPFVRLGVFAQVDTGRLTRRAFLGVDAMGVAQVGPPVGGRATELWVGPLLRIQWRQLYGEIGWAAVGRRWDDARDDLPNSDGRTDGAFRTSRRVAWSFALGAEVPLVASLALTLRVQYRVRYYDRRGGAPLIDDAVHGTQGITPFIGVSWRG